MREKANVKIENQGFMQGVFTLIFSQVFIKILGLIYKLYLTNLEGFGDKGNAIYSSGFQIYAFLLTISSVGVPGAISKLVSEKISIGDEKNADRIFKVAFIMFAFIGLVGSIILFLGAKYIANNLIQIPEAEMSIVVLSPAIFFVAISSVMKGYFNGRQNLKATANSQLIEQIFKAIITIVIVEILIILNKSNTEIMAAGANLATSLSTLISFFYIYLYYKTKNVYKIKQTKIAKYRKEERIRQIFKNIILVAIPMSLTALMLNLNKSIDSVTVVRLLKNFMTEEEAKMQYGMLSGKIDTLIMLPLSFNIAFSTALVPAISSAKAIGDNRAISKKISFSLLITMLISLPCTMGFIAFAQPILNLLFPNANSGASVLQVSALIIVFLSLEQTINGALQGLGKVFIPSVSLFFGIISKLVLNILLIGNQDIGIMGASIATISCHIIALLISVNVLRKNMKFNLNIKNFIIKPTLASFTMIISSIVIYQTLLKTLSSSISLIIALMTALIIYIILVLILKIFNKEEINMLPYGEKITNLLKN